MGSQQNPSKSGLGFIESHCWITPFLCKMGLGISYTYSAHIKEYQRPFSIAWFSYGFPMLWSSSCWFDPKKNIGTWGQKWAIFTMRPQSPPWAWQSSSAHVQGMNIHRSSIAKLGLIPQYDRKFLKRPCTKKNYISIFWKNPGSYFENHIKLILGSQWFSSDHANCFQAALVHWNKWHQWFSARRLDTSRYLHSPALKGMITVITEMVTTHGDLRWCEQPILCWCHGISPTYSRWR